MKHKFTQLIFLSVFALICDFILAGCTHNNGDIGSLFGTWKLKEIRIDNEKDTGYDGSVFWAFQSSTIRMTKIRPYHDRDEVYGSWRLEDNTLFLDFPDEQYAPIPDTMLPRQSELQLLRMSHSSMTLMYTENNAEGRQIIYEFQKW